MVMHSDIPSVSMRYDNNLHLPKEDYFKFCTFMNVIYRSLFCEDHIIQIHFFCMCLSNCFEFS